jgi:hypothetical protein
VDSWSLTVEIPASDLVRRKGKFVRRAIGIPALHNLRGVFAGAAVVKAHKAALDAGLLAKWGPGAANCISSRLRLGHRFDVLLIRRAPRPLDSAIQHGEWGDGGRMIYGDNAGSALKAARDWTAKRIFGLAGDSSPLLRWHVGQERSSKPRQYQLAILIRPAPAEIARCCELPVRWLMGELC